MASRAGLWIMRILASTLMLGATTGWSASAQSPAARPRVALIGDRNAGPDAGAFGDVLAKAWPGPGAPRLTDYSRPGADLDEVIRRQLGPLIDSGADLVILRLGPADLDAVETVGYERPVALFSTLLATVMTRTRARVIVSTTPRSAGEPAADRRAAVRRLRRIDLYNDAVGALSRRAGATVIDGESPAGAWVWREAVDAALGREPDPSDAQAIDQDAPPWLNAAAIASLRKRAGVARAAGQRPQVLAKVGDSMTAAPEFLASLMADGPEWTAAPELVTTAAFFNSTPASSGDMAGSESARDPGRDRDDVSNFAGRAPIERPSETSFTRSSLAARARWAAADVLAGGADSPLARELAVTRPAVAVVMFGTNDLTRATVDEFEETMDQLLAELESAAVIPLLSTIPSRTDRADFGGRVPAFNAAIRALAAVHGLPLIDYGRAMSELPNHGLAGDGIHPSVCPEGPQVLAPACMQYGYNLRNLLTLQTLDMLRRLVLTAEDVQ